MKPIAILSVVLLAAVVLAGCAGEGNKDTDGDGLNDREEKAGWPIIVDKIGRRIIRESSSDPTLRDTDGDGVDDFTEFIHVPPLDASNSDTDGDGLTDCQELLHTSREFCEDPLFEGPYNGGYGTDATKEDSDHGPSRYSRSLGFIDPTGYLTADAVTWGDGLPDGQEVRGFNITLTSGQTRFVKTSPVSIDTDDDGLEDGEEVLLFSSDPTVKDTDGDGCMDGYDLFPGRDQEYTVGLQKFLWKGEGSARIAASIQIGDAFVRFPESGTFTASSGEEEVLDLEQEGIEAVECGADGKSTFPAHRGLLYLQVTVSRETATGQANVDIFSQTRPGEGPVGEVYFQPRQGTYVWGLTDDGTGPMEGDVIHWVGSDGEVWFRITPQ